MKTIPVSLLGTALLLSCGNGHDGHDHGPNGHTHGEGEHSHDAGAHGGKLYVLGDHAAHLEVVHDAGAGKVTLYVTGADAEKPLVVQRPPQLKLTTSEGPVTHEAKPVKGMGGSQFAVEGLAPGELAGRVTVYVGDRTYNPELE